MAKCEHSVTVCSQKICTKTQDILIVKNDTIFITKNYKDIRI